jgi:hypothetical protein
MGDGTLGPKDGTLGLKESAKMARFRRFYQRARSIKNIYET